MQSSHYVRSDGTEQSYSLTDRVIEPSGYTNRGFCRGLDPENPIGSTYVSTYYRYVHPQSGEILTPFGIAINEVVTGTKTAEKAMKEATQKINKAIGA